jgi:hypothetical protein
MMKVFVTEEKGLASKLYASEKGGNNQMVDISK